MENSVNTLLALVLLGLPGASRNNAYPVFLLVWGALINGAVMLIRSRRFLTATGGPGGWHSLFPDQGVLDQGSLFPLRALFITVPQLLTVLEALFMRLSSGNLPATTPGRHYYCCLFCR